MGIGLEGVNASGDFANQGIVPRAISELFNRISSLSEKEGDSFKSHVLVSFLELYNEELVDLLNPRPKTTSGGGPSIREDGFGKIVWMNVKEEEVSSPEELLSVLQRGTLCRTTGSTDMNATSSRSHAIFTVTLRQEKIASIAKDQAVADDDVLKDVKVPNNSLQTIISKFHFVDLAGSERLKRTNAEGDRKKEGISINQGLLALGNVISALGDESRKSSHVPYRDSKLTRMLQDSLGGNSQTLMLACVSPSDLNYGETVNTLHYANRARNIKNRVMINQEWFSSTGGSVGAMEKDREIKMLRQTVSQLRTEIAMIRAGGVGAAANIPSADSATGASTAARALEQKEAQYYLRRERDLLSELEKYKEHNRTIRFQSERLNFKCFRLTERVKFLIEELTQTTIDRDRAIIEKSRLLNPDIKIRVKGDQAIVKNVSSEGTDEAQVPEDDKNPSSPVSGKRSDDLIVEDLISDDEHPTITRDAKPKHSFSTDPNLSDVHPVIQSYISTISALRLQLTETEDKLAWHTEAMSKLGKKGARLAQPFSAWTEESDKQLGITSTPIIKPIMHLLDKADNEIQHEKSLMKGLRDNPKLQQMLQPKEAEIASPSKSEKRGIPNFLNMFFGASSNLVTSEPTGASNDIGQTAKNGDNSMTGIEDNSAADPDMYLLINKIQNDIAQHEALVERIHKRDAEYEVMKKAYEQKLNVLQSQMTQFQKERDLALKRMQEASGVSKKDRAGNIAAAKNKYDEEKRRLDTQIAEYRRKLGENSRMQNTSRTRTDLLTKELQSTIESLKGEKARMLKELRKEAQKHRDASNANQREIARLRRKERAAAETAKRLERNNQLQRLMLKKRNEEMIRSQNKLKSVMQLLKRSSTPNRIFKSMVSGVSSPTSKRSNGNSRPSTGNNGMHRIMSDAAVNEFLAGVNSPIRMNTETIATSKPSVEVRAEFKKQMIDKELKTCVMLRRTQRKLVQYKQNRQRLVEEQRELITERGRVVQAEYERTGLYDQDVPQYMDERLQAIDTEISVIDTKMSALEDILRRQCGLIRLQTGSDSPVRDETSDVDFSWENALNLMRCLDRLELEACSALLLEDIIKLNVSLEDEKAANDERTNAISELKRMVEVLRTAAISQSEMLNKQKGQYSSGERASNEIADDNFIPEDIKVGDGFDAMHVDVNNDESPNHEISTDTFIRRLSSLVMPREESPVQQHSNPPQQYQGSTVPPLDPVRSPSPLFSIFKRKKSMSPIVFKQGESPEPSSPVPNMRNPFEEEKAAKNPPNNDDSESVRSLSPLRGRPPLLEQPNAEGAKAKMLRSLSLSSPTRTQNKDASGAAVDISTTASSIGSLGGIVRIPQIGADRNRDSISPIRRSKTERSDLSALSGESADVRSETSGNLMNSAMSANANSNPFMTATDLSSRVNAIRKRYGYDPNASLAPASISHMMGSNAQGSPTGGTLGGADVFERLANAHTQASQAKVIQRITIDKDALLQECASGVPPAATAMGLPDVTLGKQPWRSTSSKMAKDSNPSSDAL